MTREPTDPTDPPSEPTEADLLFWEQNITRVTSYVTTNGLIEISLCGVYATAIAVLIAIDEGRALQEQNLFIFSFLIPAFSLVALTLAANVYGWIRMQLDYLDRWGEHPEELESMVSYEGWKHQVHMAWSGRTKWYRVRRTLVESVKRFVTLPFHVNRIYDYYFLLYCATGTASIIYAISQGTHILYGALILVLQIVFLGIGIHDEIKLGALPAADLPETVERHRSTMAHRGETQ